MRISIFLKLMRWVDKRKQIMLVAFVKSFNLNTLCWNNLIGNSYLV